MAYFELSVAPSDHPASSEAEIIFSVANREHEQHTPTSTWLVEDTDKVRFSYEYVFDRTLYLLNYREKNPTMSLLQPLASTSRSTSNLPVIHAQTRSWSSSPYGRTHVWRRRAPKLPNPVVPEFPQRVIRSDGSSFTHWTTSPRSLLRLTRDLTNNPFWNIGLMTKEGAEEESAVAGRLGRFKRRFGEDGKEGGFGSVGSSNVDEFEWMEAQGGVDNSKAMKGRFEGQAAAAKGKK